MFIHRRKFLRSNLLGAMKQHMGKPEVDAIMESQDFGPKTRAEELDVETMIRFSEAVRQQAPDWHL
jgi:16S rRNA (adenine1518-N6/adenine1519-N6)-dimethyltransferase